MGGESFNSKSIGQYVSTSTQYILPTQFKVDVKADVDSMATDVHIIYSSLTILMKLANCSPLKTTSNTSATNYNKDSSPSSSKSEPPQLVSLQGGGLAAVRISSSHDSAGEEMVATSV